MIRNHLHCHLNSILGSAISHVQASRVSTEQSRKHSLCPLLLHTAHQSHNPLQLCVLQAVVRYKKALKSV